MVNVYITQTKNGKWGVRLEKREKYYRVYDTQKQAIDSGKQVAKNQKGELYIKGRNQKIRQKNSHGNDPYPPKG